MKVLRGVISVIATIALVAVFVGAGFLVCTTPPVTQMLANTFSDDVTSPFSRSQLVQVANATRDYSFGAHDQAALYRTIYEVDRDFERQIESSGGIVPADFPYLDAVNNPSDPTQVAAVFARASEMYCYWPETVSHLDDCFALAKVAYPALAVLALVGVACLVFAGVTGGKRTVGSVLRAAGIVVLVAFVGLGAWAAIDFSGFFTQFHTLFFSQGNWTFPYDSLLICALPTTFWAGMGVVWLFVTLLVSLICVAAGSKMCK